MSDAARPDFADDARHDEPGACRACGRPALVEVLDLGDQPEASAFPDPAEADSQPRFPLRVAVCSQCWLMQLHPTGPPEAMASGPPGYELSETLRDHADRFAVDVISRVAGPLDRLQAIDMASHGGYLAPFLAAHGLRTTVLEGSPPMAAEAARRGFRVERAALGRASAADLLARTGPVDVVVDNYLLAHVVDPDDFVAGLARLLRDGGIGVLEFDHALRLVQDRRYDAIRHGHFSYLALSPVAAMLARHGLVVVEATAQPVYGGALRIVVSKQRDANARMAPSVNETLAAERAAGLDGLDAYRRFSSDVDLLRGELRAFLVAARARGEVVVGYGAPSRGSTLLNASGIGIELLPYTVDRSPAKHGRSMPGSGIPIRHPDRIRETRPDYVLILTWDLRDEVMAGLGDIATWGGRFVIPVPRLEVLSAA